jgi:heme/copper-type cytochrome/quinol oxidase subunit 2
MTAAPAMHPAPAAHTIGLGALWFGLFGAPLAWSAQLLLNYGLVAHACFPASIPRTAPMFDALWVVVLIASLAAAIVAVLALSTAIRGWRRTREEHPGGHEALLERGEGRTRFMAIAGILLSTIFLFGIVMNTLPLFLVSPCG